jgi:hypothetical protein
VLTLALFASEMVELSMQIKSTTRRVTNVPSPDRSSLSVLFSSGIPTVARISVVFSFRLFRVPYRSKIRV